MLPSVDSQSSGGRPHQNPPPSHQCHSAPGDEDQLTGAEAVRSEADMAGDWIKWTKGLARKGKVVTMASRLKRDRHEIAGRLMVVWEWTDEETVDGKIPGVGSEFIDEIAGLPGLGTALLASGWLAQTHDGIEFVNYVQHNGPTAKSRALATRRQAASRSARDGSVTNVTLGALPEKRREEKTEKKKKKEPSAKKLAWDETFGFSGISPDDLSGWKTAYPACDIARQLAGMDQWLKSNPEKAHKTNWRRFVTNWLARAQDRGGDMQTPRVGRTAHPPTGVIDPKRQERESMRFPEVTGHVPIV